MCLTSRDAGCSNCDLFSLVVRLDVGVGDLHLAGHLLEDLLREHARPEVVQHLLLGEALLLQLVLVLRLVALEELLLELVEARVELLVRDGDVELLGGDLELGLLDEAADERVAELRELGRPGGGKVLLARLVGRLRLAQQPVVLGLRDLAVADDRDRIRRDVAGRAVVVVAAAAARGVDAESERSK